VGLVTNILFPVDFSDSSVAMAPYVKRAASLFGARVSLIHVFDPTSYNAFELYVRKPADIAEEHQNIGRDKLHAFLPDDFPSSECRRILAAGDAATRIAEIAKGGFDLIIMPTHSGMFRPMLLGSTTAKVLNDADCPVVTSKHTLTIAPRPLEHREYLCAIGLDDDSERVLRYATRLAMEAHAKLHIIHAIHAADPNSPVHLGLNQKVQSDEREHAYQRIAGMQRKVGSDAPVQIVFGPIKDALVETVRQFDADGLLIGRGPQSGAHGRDLTYAIVRDSPFPVISI
jgi:nucleotide-binding universal stress UspA family protein